eukprot:g1574.t1
MENMENTMNSAFVATFLDPYLDDDAIAEDTLENAANSMAYVLESVSRRHHEIPTYLTTQLRQCAELSKVLSQIEDSKAFLKIVEFISRRVRELSIGEFLFVPGGWRDGISQDVLAVYVIQKLSDVKITFTICDTSRWSAPYQERSYETLPKVRRRARQTLEDVDLKRVTDPVFLLTILSLRRPAESHRVEMVYDVLLPWLAQRPVLFTETTKSQDDFRTPSRAYQTSGYRSLLESVRFVLKLSGRKWKELTFHMREELLRVCEKKKGSVEHRIAEMQISRAREKCQDEKERRHKNKDELRRKCTTTTTTTTKRLSKTLISDAIRHLVNIHRVKTDSFRGSQMILNRKLFPSLSIFNTKITCFQDISSVLLRCNQVVRESLMRTYKDQCTESVRLATQHEIIQLISHLTISVLPIPTIEDKSNVWTKSVVTSKQQRQVLKSLYELLYTFGLMWQDVENASRAFESQRALVAMCVLCMFDAVLRLNTPDSVVSSVFRDEFYFSTNVGRSLR